MSLRYDKFWSERYNLDHGEIFELRRRQRRGEEETREIGTKIKHIYKEGREKKAEQFSEKRELTRRHAETVVALHSDARAERHHQRTLKEEQDLIKQYTRRNDKFDVMRDQREKWRKQDAGRSNHTKALDDARWQAKKTLLAQRREKFLDRHPKRELDFSTTPGYRSKAANSSAMLDKNEGDDNVPVSRSVVREEPTVEEREERKLRLAEARTQREVEEKKREEETAAKRAELLAAAEAAAEKKVAEKEAARKAAKENKTAKAETKDEMGKEGEDKGETKSMEVTEEDVAKAETKALKEAIEEDEQRKEEQKNDEQAEQEIKIDDEVREAAVAEAKQGQTAAEPVGKESEAETVAEAETEGLNEVAEQGQEGGGAAPAVVEAFEDVPAQVDAVPAGPAEIPKAADEEQIMAVSAPGEEEVTPATEVTAQPAVEQPAIIEGETQQASETRAPTEDVASPPEVAEPAPAEVQPEDPSESVPEASTEVAPETQPQEASVEVSQTPEEAPIAEATTEPAPSDAQPSSEDTPADTQGEIAAPAAEAAVGDVHETNSVTEPVPDGKATLAPQQVPETPVEQQAPEAETPAPLPIESQKPVDAPASVENTSEIATTETPAPVENASEGDLVPEEIIEAPIDQQVVETPASVDNASESLPVPEAVAPVAEESAPIEAPVEQPQALPTETAGDSQAEVNAPEAAAPEPEQAPAESTQTQPSTDANAKICVSCSTPLTQQNASKNQLKKPAGQGKCNDCVSKQ